MKRKLFAFVLLAALGMSVQAQTVSSQNNGPKVGLKCFLEGGLAAGESVYSEVPVSLLATMGYQINRHLYIGVGSGENFFSSSGVYGIPFYGDARIYFQSKYISPFVDAKIGYSIADIKGLYLSPSVGLRFGSSINTAFTISIGYEIQKIDEEKILSYNYKSTKTLGGINVRFGFEF